MGLASTLLLGFEGRLGDGLLAGCWVAVIGGLLLIRWKLLVCPMIAAQPIAMMKIAILHVVIHECVAAGKLLLDDRPCFAKGDVVGVVPCLRQMGLQMLLLIAGHGLS
ncbi:hypothetical protein ACLOJK_015355 [Asimina triloba]